MSAHNCIDDKRHYQVISPEMSRVDVVCDDGTGPLEYWKDWGIVLAKTKHEARWLAVKSDNFRSWRQEARDAHILPVSGLEVDLCLCEHGVCWGCDGLGNCAECENTELRAAIVEWDEAESADPEELTEDNLNQVSEWYLRHLGACDRLRAIAKGSALP